MESLKKIPIGKNQTTRTCFTMQMCISTVSYGFNTRSSLAYLTQFLFFFLFFYVCQIERVGGE